MERVLEILKAQSETLEEAIRIAKTNELLARSVVSLLEKVKAGISGAEEILKTREQDEELNS